MKMSIICAVILVLFAVSETNAGTEYLDDHFRDLYSPFGANSTTVVNLVSGPANVAMNRGGTAGKQWIAESGGYLFKLTIEDATNVTIGALVDRIEELPELYIRACKEVSDDGEDGIAIYLTLGGAAAYGTKELIDMDYRAGSLFIAHEAGHVLEQVATEGDSTILAQWAAAKLSDNVSVSSYGDGARSLTPGVNDGWEDDPNGNGVPNIAHFAFDTDPLGSGVAEGKRWIAVSDVGGTDYLTLTLPVRNGAVFGGDPLLSDPVDGIIYTILGDLDLQDPWDLDLMELTPALDTDLPALGDYDGVAGADWEYRTFRLTDPVSAHQRAFLKAGVTTAP
jgi:hypothetical protein